MPKYKLGTVKGKVIKEINLNSVLKLGNNQLEKLDDFTIEFKDENELKNYLLKKEILDISDAQNKLKVIYSFKGTKKLDVLYSDIKKYMNTSYLRSQLQILTKTDLEFLRKLRDHYDYGGSPYNGQGLNINDINVYLKDVRNSGGKPFDCKYLDIAIEDLFLKAIFRPIDIETGEAKEDYRGYRDLALFIYKYRKKQENDYVMQETTPQPLEVEQLSLFNKNHVEYMKNEQGEQKKLIKKF